MKNNLNPYVTIRLYHPYHLDESIFIFRGFMSNVFSFLFHFSIKLNSCLQTKGIPPDGKPRTKKAPGFQFIYGFTKKNVSYAQLHN